jgi:hypothetical protein
MQQALKAIAGMTHMTAPDEVFDTDEWDNNAFIAEIKPEIQTWDSFFNWV